MKVMVFGVFDGLHPGHLSFLTQARGLGDYLIAVVARDEAVARLKKHRPHFTLAERMEALTNCGLTHEVVMGDEQEGSWEVLDKHKPDIIALGYDQGVLKKNLESVASSCKLVILEAHEPKRFKSSLMNKEA